MPLSREYRKIYRRFLMRDAIKKHRFNLWLDRKSERPIQLMAALFFSGFILSIAYGYKTLASWSQISQLFFALAVLFSFLPKSWLPFIFRVRRDMKILLCIAALAPFATGLVLMLNYHVTVKSVTQIEKVINYKYNYTDRIILVELENEELNKHVEIRKFSMGKYAIEPDSAVFLINTGCFGLKTIHDPWLIPKEP